MTDAPESRHRRNTNRPWVFGGAADGRWLVLQITPTERMALQLLAEGKSRSQIAVLLGVGDCDAEDLLVGLFGRMRARTQFEAVAAAAQRGLIDVKVGGRSAEGEKSRSR